MYKTLRVLSASKMTYIVSGGALNSTHSLTIGFLLAFEVVFANNVG